VTLTLYEYIGLHMHHAITGYFKDATGHWVAKLDCGHDLPLQHNPPAANNDWALTQTGRDDKIGVILLCSKCIAGAPRDREFNQFVVSQF
jgi:Protein of unknown function (DUF3565)